MSLIDILIILGCVAGGYWIVSSVMGPGIDITRSEPPQEGARDTSVVKRAPNPRQADWHLLLDVPREASRG